MSPEQFTYWLQGFTELSGSPPTEVQWGLIKQHLDTVLKKAAKPYPFISGGTAEIQGNTFTPRALQGKPDFLK
jgi:hypothetical protein